MSKKAKPLQVAITTLQPVWRQGESGSVGVWQYCLPNRLWCLILARFGVWSICGHLRTCKDKKPIPGAVVKAFDADWLQDDALGSATTDFNGHFLISYLRDDFEKTPLSAWGINFELVGGPDVYFTAELGGSTILQETQADGRKPGRQNVGPCLCVDLCTDKVIVGDPETVPHWQQVEVFDIHPTPGTLGSHFSVEGYAGDPSTGAFVFRRRRHAQGQLPAGEHRDGQPARVPLPDRRVDVVGNAGRSDGAAVGRAGGPDAGDADRVDARRLRLLHRRQRQRRVVPGGRRRHRQRRRLDQAAGPCR